MGALLVSEVGAVLALLVSEVGAVQIDKNERVFWLKRFVLQCCAAGAKSAVDDALESLPPNLFRLVELS